MVEDKQAALKERLEKQLALLKEQIAQRKEAEEALRRESGLVKLLQEVAAAANESETITEAFQFTVDRVCDYTGWPVGHVFVPATDGSGEIVSSHIWRRGQEQRYRAFRDATESVRLVPGVDWLGRVFVTGQMAWIQDVFAEPDFVRSHSMVGLPVRSAFAFPVLVGSEVAAAVEFFAPETTAPDESLLEGMSFIAAQLGHVIERVQVGDVLKRNQTLLADAERLAGLGSWEWDVLSGQVTPSDEMFRIYGLSQEDFDGTLESFLAHAHPDEYAYVLAIIQQASEHKTPFRFHHRVLWPNGQVRTLFVRGKPILNQDGELIRVIGTGQDVTEQKEAADKLAHRAEQLAALGEMGQTVTSTLDLETVLDKVLDRLLRLLRAESAYVLLLDGEEVILAAGTNVRGDNFAGTRMLAADGVAGEVLQSGQPIALFGVEAGKRVFKQLVGTLGYCPGSLLVAPLSLGDELLGVLEVFHLDEFWFNDEDLQLLEAAASWTAIAIGNARLFEREEEARRTAEKMREANVGLTQSLELDTVLHTLLADLAQLINCDTSSVRLMEGSHLIVGEVHGRQDAAAGYNLVNLAGDHPLKVIAESGHSLFIEDTATFESWDEQLGRPDELRSWLGVPLLAGGRFIGVYTAGSGKARHFEERHLLLAEMLAGQAAIAVQNARLYAQVRISRERLRYLTKEVVTAQEEERRRISRELHDEAGQALTALKIGLDIMQAGLPAEQAMLRDQLSEAIALTDDTMEQIRLLAHDLRPPALDALGLNLSLESFCADFARRTGLVIQYDGCELPALADAARISFYRFLQEALTNAAKHAQAREIWVTLKQTMDLVCLSVRDDGRGFEMGDEFGSIRSGGVGLIGMQERFELLGGQLVIRSKPDEGTELLASIPLDYG